jgi:SAM-dependent methyltransferase
MVLTLEGLMAGVDTARLEGLRAKYPAGPVCNPEWLKFLDWREYGQRAIARTETLQLTTMPPQDILDVGCGPGYFVLACRFLWHRAKGLDLPDGMYQEAWNLMGLTGGMITEPLCVGDPLSLTPQSFDLITMFGFGLPRVRLSPGSVRSAETWDEYADGLLMVLRLLRPGGLFCALLNYGRDWLFDRDKWQALASELNGTLSGSANLFRIRVPR